MIKAVLFDLDGTLADTAPDLASAVNVLRAARQMPPLPLAATRPVTSHGARGLLGVGLGIGPDDKEYDSLRNEFLAIYEANLCRETKLFPGMSPVLAALEKRRVPWGVVTNKIERFTLPLLDALELKRRASCIVSGDTTPHTKPHPAPLLAASQAIAVEPQACLYLGDDRRDVDAAHAAGMKAAVAGWGYLNGNDSDTWGADWILARPEAVLELLD